jgi:hypothetical protein
MQALFYADGVHARAEKKSSFWRTAAFSQGVDK